MIIDDDDDGEWLGQGQRSLVELSEKSAGLQTGWWWQRVKGDEPTDGRTDGGEGWWVGRSKTRERESVCVLGGKCVTIQERVVGDLIDD